MNTTAQADAFRRAARMTTLAQYEANPAADASKILPVVPTFFPSVKLLMDAGVTLTPNVFLRVMQRAVADPIEAIAYRSEKDQPPAGRGYSAADTRTSIAMGSGAVTLGLAFRAAALVAYTALYAYAAPWHAPADRWWTWVILFFLVDILWYCYHRTGHRVRLVWAAHQAHHSSEYFNFSTATRQKWNQWFEALIWLPLPLLGMPPGLIYAAFSLNLIYQFFTHTERIDKLPRPIEFTFNSPSHHPSSPPHPR